MGVDELPRAVPAAQWPGLAEALFRFNRAPDGGVHCLHADQGADVAAHAAELARLPVDEAAFWVVEEAGGRLQAVAGCEFDPVIGRAWLRGPVAVDAQALARCGPPLLRALEAGLPGLACFDAFPSESDAALNALYESAAYRRVDVHRVLQAPLAAPAGAPDPRVRRATAADLPALLALHHALFPTGYLKDEDVAEALARPDRCVLVACADGAVAGYLVARDEAQDDEAYVDYLGVDETRRGDGLGAGLLQCAMRWGWELGRHHASLTARRDRLAALALYQRLGYVQVSAGVQWRRQA